MGRRHGERYHGVGGGASIAGPSPAHWLLQRGAEVTVVERALGLRPGRYAADRRGVAREVIRRMGLDAEVRAARLETAGAYTVDVDGNLVETFRADGSVGSDGPTSVTARFVALDVAARADLVLPRGAIIRAVDERAAEPEVDLLVMEYRDAGSGFAIMVVSGYKAGITSLSLPVEARKELGISTSWLWHNWTDWYSDTRPDEILVADAGYRLR